MHVLYSFLNFVLITAVLAFVFGVPVIIIRTWNMREKRKVPKK